MVDIYDWNDLDAVRNDLTADYTLQNDLGSSTAGYAGIGDDWTPLGFVSGDQDGNAFEGTLNGQGYQISDLVIEENTSSQGGVAFITRVDRGGLVENLEVDGTVDSTIDDAKFAGLVANVGTFDSSTIRNCVSHIDVTATNGLRCGSLVGRISSFGTVDNCYATGSVDGGDIVGGLVGRNDNEIKTSYAVGSPLTSGGTYVGGLVGYSGGTITDSYFDNTNASAGDGSTATGLTTSEMQGQEASTNMTGFDFTNVWDTVLTEDSDTSADGYPILQGLDRTNQLQAQGLYVVPKDGIYVDGTEYDCLVDGTQYDVVQN